MAPTPTKRWFTAIPMSYVEDAARFWYTDGGLLSQAFAKVGVYSRFVAWGEPVERADRPLILCRPDQMRDPTWWGRWNLDGVVLTSWAAPKYEPIARAIKQSGTRLILRLDSDGLTSPRVDFRRYLANAYNAGRESGVFLALTNALLKTLWFRFQRSAYDAGTSAHLSHADAIVIESPLARERLTRYLKVMGREDLVSRIHVVPHPVKAEIVYDPSVRKDHRIIAVGRWESYQKDAPRLIRVLCRTLADFRDYSAVLVGSGGDLLRRLVARVPIEIQSRITITGPIEHDRVQRECQVAQTILFTSRYEGFPFAAGEALCCGCTVVGPTELAFLNYICSRGAGTASMSRSVQDLVDALNAEINAWRSGERNPQQISQGWRDRLAAKSVASTLMGLFP